METSTPHSKLSTSPQDMENHSLLSALLTKTEFNKLNDYYKLELTQIVDNINSLETFRIQMNTFFGTGNLTVCGIALNSQKSGLLFLASIIMIISLLTDMRFRTRLITLFYRGIQLQRRFAPDDDEVFLQILPGRMVYQAKEILKLTDPIKKQSELRNTFRPGPYSFLCIYISVLEIIIGLLLFFQFRWTIF